MKAFLSIFAACCLLCGCSYEQMPPKTADGTTEYVLPQGKVPTEAEMQWVSQTRAEYEEWLENN